MTKFLYYTNLLLMIPYSLTIPKHYYFMIISLIRHCILDKRISEPALSICLAVNFVFWVVSLRMVQVDGGGDKIEYLFILIGYVLDSV